MSSLKIDANYLIENLNAIGADLNLLKGPLTKHDLCFERMLNALDVLKFYLADRFEIFHTTQPLNEMGIIKIIYELILKMNKLHKGDDHSIYIVHIFWIIYTNKTSIHELEIIDEIPTPQELIRALIKAIVKKNTLDKIYLN